MTSLILMYVYFDVNGDIKAITPSLDDSLSKGCTVTTFPLTEVELFLSGKKNTFDYTVQSIKKLDSTKYIISKKYNDIVHTRTLDNYLTKISEDRRPDTIITITNNLSKKNFCIELSSEIRDIVEHGTEEARDLVSDFINVPISSVYITKKNNPYVLLFTFNFSPRALYEQEKIYIDYNVDCTESSAYTKKIINGYLYKLKG